VLLINKNDLPTLLRNDGGNTSNWLVIRTEGVRSNRAGIGARVAVTVAGKRRILDVRGSESYLSGNDLRVHFGIGDHARADAVEIRWPSGQLDHYADVPVNSFYLAREADGLKPDPWIKPAHHSENQAKPGTQLLQKSNLR